MPNPVGRPPYPYTEELGQEISDRLMVGESMRHIALDKLMPSRITMLKWMRDNEDFRAKCASSRMIQAESANDVLSDIVDQVLEGTMAVDAARVAASVLPWKAAKLWPKKWGEKQVVENVGPGGGPVLSTNMTPDEFEARARKVASEV